MKISLSLIVKNEEEVLPRCLESVKYFADEIIIIDTGSNDKTKEIASKYTDRIYDLNRLMIFRQLAILRFRKLLWIIKMWLDADDVPESLSRKLMN